MTGRFICESDGRIFATEEESNAHAHREGHTILDLEPDPRQMQFRLGPCPHSDAEVRKLSLDGQSIVGDFKKWDEERSRLAIRYVEGMGRRLAMAEENLRAIYRQAHQRFSDEHYEPEIRRFRETLSQIEQQERDKARGRNELLRNAVHEMVEAKVEQHMAELRELTNKIPPQKN